MGIDGTSVDMFRDLVSEWMALDIHKIRNRVAVATRKSEAEMRDATNDDEKFLARVLCAGLAKVIEDVGVLRKSRAEMN